MMFTLQRLGIDITDVRAELLDIFFLSVVYGAFLLGGGDGGSGGEIDFRAERCACSASGTSCGKYWGGPVPAEFLRTGFRGGTATGTARNADPVSDVP